MTSANLTTLAKFNPDQTLNVLGMMIRSHGAIAIAEKVGSTPAELFEQFRPGGKPSFELAMKVMLALGIALGVTAPDENDAVDVQFNDTKQLKSLYQELDRALPNWDLHWATHGELKGQLLNGHDDKDRTWLRVEIGWRLLKPVLNAALRAGIVKS